MGNTLNPIWSILVPAVSGLLAGIVGSLVAPWVNWGIEKRRMKFKRRQDIVDRCREHAKKFQDLEQLCNSPEYVYIRPFIDGKILECIEDPSNWTLDNYGPRPLYLE